MNILRISRKDIGSDKLPGGENMTRERFEKTNWKMTFEQFKACDCTECSKQECKHRKAFRRVPEIDGGLGLCPNLKAVK